MKSEKKSILSSSEKSKLEKKSATNNNIDENFDVESQHSVKSTTETGFNTHKAKSSNQHESAHISPQDFGAMVISLNNTMKSHVNAMELHIDFMKVAWNQVVDNQTAMRQEFKESTAELQQEFKEAQNDIKTIKHDMHDSNGHLAISIKESEKRIIATVEDLIAHSEEVTRAKVALEIAKNNENLLTKTISILVFGVTVVALGVWLF